MQKLLFFSRVAFICNICFVLAFLMKYVPDLKDGYLTSTVLILGVGLAFGLNLLVNLITGVFLLQRKYREPPYPSWLIIANFLFLIPQLIVLLR